MKLMRSTSLIAAFALLAMTASEAAAQAPVLSATASGATVTIEWTDLQAQGALGYNLQVGTTPGGAQIGSLNLPTTVTRIVVAAPAGTYFLRVRGLAGSTFGPFSNEASVTVGANTPSPSPCGALGQPNVTATVSGMSVTVNWGGDPGAVGYRVEFSLTPGGTDLVQTVGAGTTSYSQYIGMVGTFYVRVVSGNSCGTATSTTIPFTIDNSTPTGSGPRTPDPAPGQVLPLPSYLRDVVVATANAYRGDLRNSCVEHGGNNVWLYRLVHALRQRDSRWGLNWKRGNRGDMSQDVVDYNFGSATDEDTTNVYIIDVIAGHCGSNPQPNWEDVTRKTRDAGTVGRWTLQPYLRAGFPADPRQ